MQEHTKSKDCFTSGLPTLIVALLVPMDALVLDTQNVLRKQSCFSLMDLSECLQLHILSMLVPLDEQLARHLKCSSKTMKSLIVDLMEQQQYEIRRVFDVFQCRLSRDFTCGSFFCVESDSGCTYAEWRLKHQSGALITINLSRQREQVVHVYQNLEDGVCRSLIIMPNPGGSGVVCINSGLTSGSRFEYSYSDMLVYMLEIWTAQLPLRQ